MKESVESALRFIQLASSGLLAGALGFGESALTPGWEKELPHGREDEHQRRPPAIFNAIGPIAIVSSVTLALTSRKEPVANRALDLLAAAGLAGVFAATKFGTVRLNQEIESTAPVDYVKARSRSISRRWSHAHTTRTVLGIGAFVCAAAAAALGGRDEGIEPAIRSFDRDHLDPAFDGLPV